MDQPHLHTRFTEAFGLATPIALAPMALAAGGALAAASARAGALGLVGGGYGETGWVQRELALARELATGEAARLLGIGFITWRLAQDSAALDAALDGPPLAAVLLSFGDPRPFAPAIARSGAALICQVQNMRQVPMALEAGAAVLVAQGAEAGGHGAAGHDGRATFTLVPELADYLAAHAPRVQLLAAGGVADGRGLAAALMLGADGALVGSRLWACAESLAAPGAQHAAVAASGDETARSSIFDILRGKDWPAGYDFRALRNALHRAWEGREAALRAEPAAARAAYAAGVAAGDFSAAHATVGEACGLIGAVVPAGSWIAAATAQAAGLLGGSGAR